jgi:hypothetical protein
MSTISENDFDGAVKKINDAGKGLTWRDAIQKWSALIQTAIANAVPPGGSWAIAAKALNVLSSADSTTTGACVYVVDGQGVCADNMTRSDCDSLNGQFFQGQSCPIAPARVPPA